jgi:thiopurine S-methyltransferase
MQANDWHERWQNGRIGFHQGEVARSLTQFWPTLDLPRGSTVFVPLCGKSLDLLWLRDQGHVVVGVELSQIAVESFFMENGILARRETRQGFDEYLAPGLRVLCGSLFDLTPKTLEPCSAIYDRASLIAMPPELQERYVEKLTELSPVGTQTLLITVEYPQHEMSGPPFSVDFLSVGRLYSAHHEVRELSRMDILASDLKLGTRVSRLHEVSYHLTRR